MWSVHRWKPGNLPRVRRVCERRYQKKQGVDTKNLPFLVHRTPSGNLPVYVEPTQKGEKFTRIRRVFGDAQHLANEVSRLCESSARVGRGGRKAVEVLGVHEKRIKEWLQHLGL
ncbi:unnamed protein product [Cladocopium goreaui]|uniref:Large ribosomal subunit protein mL49 n=1 Tax=Cladocopium goreaui TaxID=2562237 RepID=A0A9P1G7T8_9DINO|nr:unnamed protein product [Cladocopium goreaui]